MATARKIANRMHALADRAAFENDLDDELRFHLEMQAEKHVERGLSPAAARSLAARELGPIDPRCSRGGAPHHLAAGAAGLAGRSTGGHPQRVAAGARFARLCSPSPLGEGAGGEVAPALTAG